MSQTTTDLELVHAVVTGVNEGSISWGDLAAILTRSEAPGCPQEPFKEVLPAVITKRQSEALERLTEVYGKVVPTTRREVTPEEVEALLDEREVLDELKKLADKRREGIRTTLLNHWDVQLENSGSKIDDIPRDKDGHYLVETYDRVADRGFQWKVYGGEPEIDPEKLKSLVSEEVWEQLTTQVLVFDEEKAMLYIKDHPEMLDTLTQAVETTKVRGVFNVQSVKST